jgi:hypothetical protein
MVTILAGFLGKKESKNPVEILSSTPNSKWKLWYRDKKFGGNTKYTVK